MTLPQSKHILFLPAWYPHTYDGMWGLFVKRHAEAVARFDQVSVLYLHGTEHLDTCKHIEQSQEEGINTVRIYYRKLHTPLPFLNKLWNSLKFLYLQAYGYKLIRNTYGSPDLLHVHILTRSGILALLLHYWSGKRYVITEHWSRYLPINNAFNGALRKCLTRTIVKHAHAVMPVTKNLQDAMESHHLLNKNYVVVPNVSDTSKFVPISKTAKDIKQFIHISCFEDKSKNISGLLRTFYQLIQSRQDVHLTMVGDGMDFAAMHQLHTDLGLQTFVTFTGLLEGKPLIEKLQQSDCLLMFSNYENMPVVINESFACGIPVIAPAVGGIAEHVTKENGLLIESKNETALLDAMMHMLDHYKEYNATTIRNYAVSHFSYEAVGLKIHQQYNKALD